MSASDLASLAGAIRSQSDRFHPAAPRVRSDDLQVVAQSDVGLHDNEGARFDLHDRKRDARLRRRLRGGVLRLTRGQRECLKDSVGQERAVSNGRTNTNRWSHCDLRRFPRPSPLLCGLVYRRTIDNPGTGRCLDRDHATVRTAIFCASYTSTAKPPGVPQRSWRCVAQSHFFAGVSASVDEICDYLPFIIIAELVAAKARHRPSLVAPEISRIVVLEGFPASDGLVRSIPNRICVFDPHPGLVIAVLCDRAPTLFRRLLPMADMAAKVTTDSVCRFQPEAHGVQVSDSQVQPFPADSTRSARRIDIACAHVDAGATGRLLEDKALERRPNRSRRLRFPPGRACTEEAHGG